jgi:hypothetical protein
VREGRPRRHIPAGAAVGGLRIDDDETLLVGQLGVGRPAVVCRAVPVQ